MSSKLVRVLRLCQTISFFFLLNLVAVSAQTITPNIKLVSPAGTSVQPSSAPTANGLETERIRALEDTLRQQNEKIDQMLKLIQRQQQMIDSLDARTGRENGNASNVSAVVDPASRPRESSEGAPVDPSVRTGGISGKTPVAGTPTTQTQQPSIEDRIKQIEERVTKIGPIRFGGDFRLRFDGTFRPATDPPDPSLQHVQNARVRYRLRLNLDSDINKLLSFHGQLSTAPINNGLTLDQDFTSTVARHPFFINEAWVDFHPNKNLQFQGGRVLDVFADNSRFLFDDDVRFNGFNERFIWPFSKGGNTNVELRAGQYWFSNPNVAVITAGSPLDLAGAEIGTIGRSSNLFHQGLLFNLKVGEHWAHQFGGDVQVFREPNQIQLASTAAGVVFIVQPGLGLTLSGPMSGTGNATTTPGGAIYTAEDFHVARLTYRLNHTGFKVGKHAYPIVFNAQVARNFGTDANERDAMLAALQVGRTTKFGDSAFLYVFSIKGANSIISQLTDDDLGTGTGVNLRTHHIRWDFGLSRNVTLQSLLFIQRELRNSGQFPNFFVPLNGFTPRQYRVQEQIVFTF
ncbi:MAG TPA: putative porin [Blastocatellia bacterium]|nr:putative porin [Blastocatellia bacterium]